MSTQICSSAGAKEGCGFANGECAKPGPSLGCLRFFTTQTAKRFYA